VQVIAIPSEYGLDHPVQVAERSKRRLVVVKVNVTVALCEVPL
jgi:hypothetical protein